MNLLISPPFTKSIMLWACAVRHIIIRVQFANGQGLTRFCGSHEIFTTRINTFGEFEHFTKILCRENLDLYIQYIMASNVQCTWMDREKMNNLNLHTCQGELDQSVGLYSMLLQSNF